MVKEIVAEVTKRLVGSELGSDEDGVQDERDKGVGEKGVDVGGKGVVEGGDKRDEGVLADLGEGSLGGDGEGGSGWRRDGAERREGGEEGTLGGMILAGEMG